MAPLALLLAAALTAAAPAPHQGHPAHAAPAAVAGEHGNPSDLESYIARLESPQRDAWQKPDEVVKALALEPAQVVCEIGAGPGYFSRRLARAVGPMGSVFAVDVEARILAALRDRLVKERIENVVPVLGAAADPLLPAAACDLVLMVNTFHHFEDGEAMLQRLKRSLRPGARLVNVDFHKRETPVGPPLAERIDRAAFLATAAKAGFAPVAEHAFLPHQYFLELRVKR